MLVFQHSLLQINITLHHVNLFLFTTVYLMIWGTGLYIARRQCLHTNHKIDFPYRTEALYICSNLLLLQKSTKTHNFGILAFWLFILQIHFIHYILNASYTIDQNINTRNHVLLMQEYQKAFIKKGKKLRKKMKKWQIENSEKLEISEKLFRVFLFSSFRFCPKAKIENPN